MKYAERGSDERRYWISLGGLLLCYLLGGILMLVADERRLFEVMAVYLFATGTVIFFYKRNDLAVLGGAKGTAVTGGVAAVIAVFYIILMNLPILSKAPVESSGDARAFAEEQRAFAKEERAFAKEERAFAEEQRAFAEEQRAFAEEQRAFEEERRASADKRAVEGMIFLNGLPVENAFVTLLGVPPLNNRVEISIDDYGFYSFPTVPAYVEPRLLIRIPGIDHNFVIAPVQGNRLQRPINLYFSP